LISTDHMDGMGIELMKIAIDEKSKRRMASAAITGGAVAGSGALGAALTDAARYALVRKGIIDKPKALKIGRLAGGAAIALPLSLATMGTGYLMREQQAKQREKIEAAMAGKKKTASETFWTPDLPKAAPVTRSDISKWEGRMRKEQPRGHGAGGAILGGAGGLIGSAFSREMLKRAPGKAGKVLPIVLPVAGAAVGAGLGYRKGKRVAEKQIKGMTPGKFQLSADLRASKRALEEGKIDQAKFDKAFLSYLDERNRLGQEASKQKTALAAAAVGRTLGKATGLTGKTLKGGVGGAAFGGALGGGIGAATAGEGKRLEGLTRGALLGAAAGGLGGAVGAHGKGVKGAKIFAYGAPATGAAGGLSSRFGMEIPRRRPQPQQYYRGRA